MSSFHAVSEAIQSELYDLQRKSHPAGGMLTDPEQCLKLLWCGAGELAALSLNHHMYTSSSSSRGNSREPSSVRDIDKADRMRVFGKLTAALVRLSDMYNVHAGVAALDYIMDVAHGTAGATTTWSTEANSGHNTNGNYSNSYAQQPTQRSVYSQEYYSALPPPPPQPQPQPTYSTYQQPQPQPPQQQQPQYSNNTYYKNNAASTTTQQQTQQQQQQQQQRPSPPALHINNYQSAAPVEDDPILSPRTTNDFFPSIDRVANYSKEEYMSKFMANDTPFWFVIDNEGRTIDLIPNGRNIPVSYEDLSDYLSMAEKYRPRNSTNNNNNWVNNTNRAASNPQEQGVNQTPRGNTTVPAAANKPSNMNTTTAPATTRSQSGTPQPPRTLSLPPTQSISAQRDTSLFSPSHFDAGLFAPYSATTQVQVQDGGQEYIPQAVAASESNKYNNTATTNSVSRNNNNTASTNKEPTNPNERFWYNVALVESKGCNPSEIDSLGITFSIPPATPDGQTEYLMPNGDKLSVTQYNCPSFLSHLRNRLGEETVRSQLQKWSNNNNNNSNTEQPSSTSNNKPGSLSRTNSGRTLTVPTTYDPHAVTAQFSPQHFSNNLFAPYSPQNVARVDENSALPQFLQDQQKQQQQQQHNNNNNNAIPDYLKGPSVFLGWFESLLNAPPDSAAQLLAQHQATWCMPSAMVVSLSPQQRRDPLYDLVHDGRHKRVMPNEARAFISKVLENSTE